MITRDDIQNLASLARIEISDDEAISLTSEVDSILGYISQIENIATDDIQETLLLKNIMRDDKVTNSPSEYTEALLSNAPSREKNMLKVKKILG